MDATVVLGLINAIVRAVAWRGKVKALVLPLIEQAASGNPPLDNAARREYVVAALMKQGLSESDARLLTEAGVKYWKRLSAKAAKKAAKRTQI